MDRRLFTASLLTGLCAGGAFAKPRSVELSLTQIVARHTKARGGRAALDAVSSMAVDIQIVEKGSVITAQYRCNKSPAYRIDIFDAGKHVFCEGLDTNGPWIWPSSETGPAQGVPDGKRTAIQGIEFNLYGLHAFESLGNRLSLEGRERLGGVDYYVIRVEMKQSYQTFLYIDPETWLIARRRDFRARHPDMDATKKNLETQYTDFRTVSGIQASFLEHQIDLASGKITQVTITDSLTYNPTLDPAIFDRGYRAA